MVNSFLRVIADEWVGREQPASTSTSRGGRQAWHESIGHSTTRQLPLAGKVTHTACLPFRIQVHSSSISSECETTRYNKEHRSCGIQTGYTLFPEPVQSHRQATGTVWTRLDVDGLTPPEECSKQLWDERTTAIHNVCPLPCASYIDSGAC